MIYLAVPWRSQPLRKTQWDDGFLLTVFPLSLFFYYLGLNLFAYKCRRDLTQLCRWSRYHWLGLTRFREEYYLKRLPAIKANPDKMCVARLEIFFKGVDSVFSVYVEKISLTFLDWTLSVTWKLLSTIHVTCYITLR